LKNFLLKYKTLIGLAVSLVFLYLSLTKIDFNDILKIFSRSNPSIIIFIILLAFLVRIILTVRWYLLLHFTEKRNLRDTFNYLNIGYLINDILPGRLGDFVKSYFWAKKVNVSKADALASVIVERLFDLTGMGLIFILALLILDLPSYALKGGTILISFCFIGFFGLLLLAMNNSKLSHFQNKYRNKNILNWILIKANKLSLYSTFLINVRLTLILFLLTIVVWFIYLFSGFLIIQDLHPFQFSWHTAVVSLLFISVAFVIPSTPGNLGVYQYACILAFEITGVGYSREEALVFSLISQLPVYFLTLLLGLYSSYSEGFKLSKLKKYTQNLETAES
jgi:glycosyltransferase 2 family protein